MNDFILAHHTNIDAKLRKALSIVWPELRSVTVDTWTDDEIEDCQIKTAIVHAVEQNAVTPDVLDEMEDCLDRDWCYGKVKTAFFLVLARLGRLEKLDPNVQHSRRPKTRTIEGTKYIIG